MDSLLEKEEFVLRHTFVFLENRHAFARLRKAWVVFTRGITKKFF